MAKTINTRIQHKHDTEANWLKATNFIPLAGELIIYDKDSSYTYERFKIGDGQTLVTNLPFALITEEERAAWNSKSMSCMKINGAPTASTKGIVGTLAMDIDSENYDLYKCVAANSDETYVWEAVVGDSNTSSQIFANVVNASKKSLDNLFIADISPIEHNVNIKVTKRNLISSFYQGTKTINGVKFTRDVDTGCITVSGTASATADYTVALMTLSAGVEYFISGCPIGGKSNTYSLFLSDGTGVVPYDFGGAVKFTLTKDISKRPLNIRISAGTTVNNLVFKPMVERDVFTGDFVKLSNTALTDVSVSIASEEGETISYTLPETGELTIKSIYPEMNISTSVQGFDIYAEYNADLNKKLDSKKETDYKFMYVKDNRVTFDGAGARYTGVDLSHQIVGGKIKFSFEDFMTKTLPNGNAEIPDILLVLTKRGCNRITNITEGAFHLTVRPNITKIDIFVPGTNSTIATAYQKEIRLMPNKEYYFSAQYKEFQIGDELITCAEFILPDEHKVLITDKVIANTDYIEANTEQLVWTDTIQPKINTDLMAEGITDTTLHLSYNTVKEWWNDYVGQYVIFEIAAQTGGTARGYFTAWMISAVDENNIEHYLRHDFKDQPYEGMLTTAPTGQSYISFSNTINDSISI